MTKAHAKKVSVIAHKVREFYLAKKPFRIFHGSTNSTRILSFHHNHMIDISRLNNVLSINAQKKTAVVEPNVAMDTLVKATLKHGLVPPIVMEFPGITVGGGIQGNGGESSSFKWGAFNQIFNWYELVLASGKTLKASKTKNADLFHAIGGSAGTLGILTAAEIQLVPAKKYVELTYTPVASFEEAKRVTDTMTRREIDFVDGIMFSRTSGVVIHGVMTDRHSTRVIRFSRARDQWYYLHVENTLQDKQAAWTESVPLTDYLFRYDRGAFWVGRFAFETFGVPYTRFMRWLLNPILHTRKLYQALQESGASQEHVVQDLVLPGEKAVTFLDYLDRELNIYPLWLCPMLVDTKSPFQLNNLQTKSILNVGVWGSNIPDYNEFIKMNRSIEKEILQVHGKKWSYAHSYFTKDEFWNMYDKPYYASLRKKYAAEHLPDIYEKLTVKDRVPVNKKKAVWRTLFGLAKLKINR